MAEIARTVNIDQSEVEASITHFYLAKRDDVRTISVAFARRQIGTGGGHGHLPWPLDCHKKFELCWPHPQNPNLIVCLEVEIPWPCPDEIILDSSSLIITPPDPATDRTLDLPPIASPCAPTGAAPAP